MKKLVVLIVMLVSTGLSVAPTIAQDATDACSQDSVNLAIAAVAKAAQDAQAADGPKAAVDVLAEVNGQIAALQAECNGMSFSGTTNGVIGPIELPEGIYKAVADTTGFMTAQINPIDGDCHQGAGDFGTPLLYMLSDKATDAQSVISSDGCTALIEVTVVAAEWSLRIEKIK